MGALPAELADDFDYVALLHRQLGISVKEERFRRPEDQPTEVAKRFWRPAPKN